MSGPVGVVVVTLQSQTDRWRSVHPANDVKVNNARAAVIITAVLAPAGKSGPAESKEIIKISKKVTQSTTAH